jgi:hypothetical protein
MTGFKRTGYRAVALGIGDNRQERHHPSVPRPELKSSIHEHWGVVVKEPHYTVQEEYDNNPLCYASLHFFVYATSATLFAKCYYHAFLHEKKSNVGD